MNQRNGQDQHCEPVQEGAQHDEHRQQQCDHLSPRPSLVTHPAGRGEREFREAEEHLEDVGSDQDQEHGSARPQRREHGLAEGFAGERATRQRHQQDQERSDPRRLHGREDAGVDSAERDRHQPQDPPGARGHPPPRGERVLRPVSRHLVRLQLHHHEDGQDEEEREQDPRNQSCHEKAADALLREDAVQHQPRRRGNQDAEGAAGGDGPCRERPVVVEPAHFRHRDPSHGQRGGQRRSGERRKPCAGDDGCRGQATPEAVQPQVRCEVEFAAHSRDHGQVPHQHEERDDDERVPR